MTDIELYESGNGGEIRLVGSDVNTVVGITNMPYMSCFGGSDWWGNALLPDDVGQRHTATTEETLRVTPLSSAGLPIIERAIQNDLAYITEQFSGTKIEIESSIPQPNRIDMNVNINGEQTFLQWQPNL
jgi:hypothetical protein